jgi:hypothetical protein
MLKLIVGLMSFALVYPAWAETVHSLDRVEKNLKTPEAKKFFSEQMEGKPAPDLLGIHLPAVLPDSAITGLLVPPGDSAKRNLIGAKPWPVRPDLYVAIACTGGAEPYSPNEPRCARSPGDEKEPPLHVYLGVIEAKDGSAPHLVAASDPVDCAMDWSKSGLPRQPMAADDTKDGIIVPQSFDRFDLARYKIAAEQPAFGLRGGWTESYSGGGANFTGLCLFTTEGDKLKQVLAVPMSAYSDVAGDWHKNQTRDHDITDAANVLIVSSNSTDGHFDLIVKGPAKGRQQRVFQWSKAGGAYQAARN